jgi:hypothetical protein
MNSKIIKEAVESAFNTSINVKSRRREIVYIRSIYYKLCKDFTKESLDAIGKHVNKDHATVLNGLKIFNNIIDNFWEKELFNVYLDIKKTIQNKITLEVKSYDPDKFYRDKYRIALLKNRKMYSYTKECISKLEQMDYKYSDILKTKLNDLIDNDNYKVNTNC